MEITFFLQIYTFKHALMVSQYIQLTHGIPIHFNDYVCLILNNEKGKEANKSRNDTILHGPSMLAVKAKIYGVLYKQSSCIAFDETSSYWSALKSS